MNTLPLPAEITSHSSSERWSMLERSRREQDPFERSLSDHLDNRSQRHRDQTRAEDHQRAEAPRAEVNKRDTKTNENSPIETDRHTDETKETVSHNMTNDSNEAQNDNETLQRTTDVNTESQTESTEDSQPSSEINAEVRQTEVNAFRDVLLNNESVMVKQSDGDATQSITAVEQQDVIIQQVVMDAAKSANKQSTQAPAQATAAEIVNAGSILKGAAKPVRQAASVAAEGQNSTGNMLLDQASIAKPNATIQPATVIRPEMAMSAGIPAAVNTDSESKTTATQTATSWSVATSQGSVSASPENYTNPSRLASHMQSQIHNLNAGLEPTNAQDRVNASRLNRALQHAVRHADTSVTLRLTPPEMGTVRIQLTVDAGRVAAAFHADTAEARDLLGRQTQQLRQSLDRQGLTLERVSIQPMQNHNASQSQTSTEQAPDDGRSRGGQEQQARRQDHQSSQQDHRPQVFSELTEDFDEQQNSVKQGASS